jgi:hypothetical protein
VGAGFEQSLGRSRRGLFDKLAGLGQVPHECQGRVDEASNDPSLFHVEHMGKWQSDHGVFVDVRVIVVRVGKRQALGECIPRGISR